MSLPPKLAEFIVTQKTEPIQRSVWFEDKKIKIYVRAGLMVQYAPFELPKEWVLGADRPGIILGITISNVTSKKRRRGTLTAAFEELKKLAIEHGYSEIRVENAASPEIQAWCEKFNFLKKAADATDDTLFSRSYYLPVGPEGGENA